MCTYLTEQVSVDGSGKGSTGWFAVIDASVYVDHPYHAPYLHTLNVDFRNPALGPSARVAVELTEESALALVEAIRQAWPAPRPAWPALRRPADPDPCSRGVDFRSAGSSDRCQPARTERRAPMPSYLLAYTGGSMPETAEAQAAVMSAWESWFTSLGEAVADPGNPFGNSASIAPDGSIGGTGSSHLTGYTILKADSLTTAVDLAKGCPVLSGGAGIEVYETVPVM